MYIVQIGFHYINRDQRVDLDGPYGTAGGGKVGALAALKDPSNLTSEACVSLLNLESQDAVEWRCRGVEGVGVCIEGLRPAVHDRKMGRRGLEMSGYIEI